MNDIKALAVDIDGTLTDHTRKLCINAIKAIRKAEAKGIPTILVTGNIVAYTRAISFSIGTSGGMVCENGGVIYSNYEVKVVADINKAQNAYAFLKNNPATKNIHKVPFAELRTSEVTLLRTDEAELIKESLKGHDIEIYDTKFALHLTDPTVNKGTSLKLVAEDLGINMSEILGIGDSENDLSFLKEVGFSVAVSNADKKLKDVVDYVTFKPYGDGVAEAITQFVL